VGCPARRLGSEPGKMYERRSGLKIAILTVSSLREMDKRAIAKLINDAYGPYNVVLGEDRVSEDLSDQEFGEYEQVAIASERSKIVGVVFLAKKQREEMFLKLIAIDRNFQQKGVGRALILAACRAARRAGASVVLGDTLAEFRLDEFFARCGFELESRHPRSSGASGGVTSEHEYRVYRAEIRRVERALNPGQIIRSIIWVVAAITVIGIYVPGFLAWRGNTMTSEQMNSLPAVARAAKVTPSKAPLLKRIVGTADKVLAERDLESLGPENSKRWLEVRELASKDIPVDSEVLVLPFATSQLNQFFWPIFIGGLLCLTTLLRPMQTRPLGKELRAALPSGLALYAIYDVQGLTRNFVLGNADRTVFSYANFDIDRWSWVYQELEHLVFFVLVAVAWHQWINFSTRQAFRLRLMMSKLVSPMGESQAASREDRVEAHLSMSEVLSETYMKWQLAAAAALAVFGAVFLFFWQSIGYESDSRYVGSAFVVHLYGVITLALISMPMVDTFDAFRRFRVRSLYEVWHDKDALEARLNVLEAIRPVSPWNLAGSAGLVLITTVAPLIRLFFK
jgi:N-acetylglutamate synthase-like GNAT family acetyltransferase